MVNGAHTIIYCEDADKARAFFKDVLKLPSVDAGRGWLIFGLPPGEVAAHPAEGNAGSHQLYLMCDNLQTTQAELKALGVEFVGENSNQPWGVLATMKIPGGGEIGIYEPRHPRPPQAKE